LRGCPGACLASVLAFLRTALHGLLEKSSSGGSSAREARTRSRAYGSPGRRAASCNLARVRTVEVAARLSAPVAGRLLRRQLDTERRMRGPPARCDRSWLPAVLRHQGALVVKFTGLGSGELALSVRLPTSPCNQCILEHHLSDPDRWQKVDLVRRRDPAGGWRCEIRLLVADRGLLLDNNGGRDRVVAEKATFRVKSDGEPHPGPELEPVALALVWSGEPGKPKRLRKGEAIVHPEADAISKWNGLCAPRQSIAGGCGRDGWGVEKYGARFRGSGLVRGWRGSAQARRSQSSECRSTGIAPTAGSKCSTPPAPPRRRAEKPYWPRSCHAREEMEGNPLPNVEDLARSTGSCGHRRRGRRRLK